MRQIWTVPIVSKGGNMQVISSKDNEFIKHIKRLKDKK